MGRHRERRWGDPDHTRSWRRARTQPQFDWIAGFPAATFGLLVWFATGFDFVRPNRRIRTSISE